MDTHIKELLNFFMRQRRLAHIDRCNQYPKIKYYSVAEHSFFVTFFGMIFCDLINHERSLKGVMKVNVEEVLRRLLIHDQEESITGDILYSLHSSNPAFYSELEKVRNVSVETQSFAELPAPIRDFYIRLWKSTKDDTDEGHLVSMMDKFEILLFSIQELSMGNTSFKHIFREAVSILKKNCRFTPIIDLVLVIESIF